MKRLLLIFAAVLISASAMAQDTNTGYVQVTGKAVKEITPNEFYVGIRIDERDSKGKISVDEQQKAMIATLRALKIDVDNALTMTNMSGDFFKKKTSLATVTYQLKLTSAKDLAEVGRALADMGLSEVRLMRVSHSDMDAFKHEVRKMAVINARECATELVSALDQKLGRCIWINDTNYDITPRFQNSMLRGAVMYDAAPEVAFEEEYVEFKTIKLEYSVQAKFVLE